MAFETMDIERERIMAQQHCPVCHCEDMTDFVELKDLPIHCNLLWSSRKAALQAPKGDVRLGFCQECGMIYNRSFDPGRMQYTQAYENSLFFSPHFQAYAQEQAAQLIERYQLRDKSVLEIGCGKGEFLSLLCRGGQNRGVGFDPSYDHRSAGSGMRETSLLSMTSTLRLMRSMRQTSFAVDRS